MNLPKLFLLLNQSDRIQISVGDRIDIVEAYGKGNFNSAFVMSCDLGEKHFEDLLPSFYTRTLRKVPRVSGQVGHIVQDGGDLIINIQQVAGDLSETDRRVS